MSMLDMASRLGNAQEAQIVPTGVEYEMEVIKMRTGATNGKNNQYKDELRYVTYALKILNPPEGLVNVRLVDVFLWDEEEQKLIDNLGEDGANSTNLNWKDFLDGIGVDWSQPFHKEDDIIGNIGWAILGSKDEGEHGMKNTIRKWVTPK